MQEGAQSASPKHYRMTAIASVNPALSQTVKTFEAIDAAELERKLALATATYERYRTTSFDQRGEWLRRSADIVETDKRRYAELAVIEMGKPIRQAIAEVEKCASACRYYAERGAAMLAEEIVETDAAQSFVRYDPLGPVLAVMPWNFPYWQVFRFAAPALMAGNVGLLKHASNVPQCALAIEEIFERAGFPKGAFQTLLVGTQAVERIVDDERVKAVTLTGSEPAGAAVASRASKQIKKAVLELGGSDPFIVMPSADLAAAASTAVTARTINTGQSCIAAKRFILETSIADTVERSMVEGFEALIVGDPMDTRTDVGPLVNEDAVRGLDEQVKRFVAAGAKVLTGGRRLDRPGCYYAPTILSGVDARWPVSCEELFGPVALIFRVRSIDEAIQVANATPFGLGSAAWTTDTREQQRFIKEIEAGAVFVNGMVKSDPRLPFGGVRRSGYGRELGVPGIREFVNIKTVWIGPARSS
jgi:succinate-semialdehyde dehydrogenase / glutarate-semialdehyde dehydrogenase